MAAPPPVRVAVLIRGHKIDEKLLDLHRHLQSDAATYDLFLLLDETNGALATGLAKSVTFSLPRCAELGLEYATPRLFWLCGDVALFFAYRALPDYTHFVMIDYDVEFVRSGPAMLNAVVARLREPGLPEIDAIGLQYSIVGPSWPYHAAAARAFGDVRFFYFPFVALSRRALAYLHAQRRLERQGSGEVVICEAFVPGHLHPAGFHCVDLNEILPGSYESRARDSSMRFHPLGMPLGARFDVGPKIEMVHPVYGAADHLARAVARLATPEEISKFIARLTGPTYAHVDPALLADCRRQLEAKAARIAAEPARQG